MCPNMLAWSQRRPCTVGFILGSELDLTVNFAGSCGPILPLHVAGLGPLGS